MNLGRGAKPVTKKAISPLVATVLLIAFAVTIGAIIMGWGQGLLEENSDEAKTLSQREVRCTVGTSLEVKVVAGDKKLCYRNITGTEGLLEFMLENNGDRNVEGVRIVMIGNNDTTEVADQDTFQIIGGGVKKGTQNFSFATLGNLTQVEFIPKVLIDAESGLQICGNRRLMEDGIFECD